MKKIFLILWPLIFFSCASSKIEFTSEIIPADCKNAVIFLRDVRPGNYNKGEYFYLDDIEEIKNIFATWKDFSKIPRFPRYSDSGFIADYNFYLIVDGKIQDCHIDGISPDGTMIVINRDGYEYNPEYWTQLSLKLKPARKETRTFATVKEYRNALKDMRNDKNYICSTNEYVIKNTTLPEKYDGYFYITTRSESWSNVKAKISKIYPDEEFEIGGQLGGGLFRTSDIKIYASKELYEKFEIYPKDKFEDFKNIKMSVYLKE